MSLWCICGAKPVRLDHKYTSNVVRDTGIEPVTSSVSGKRSPAELIAPGNPKLEVETGIEPVCTALQAVASPLGHSTAGLMPVAPSSG